MVEGETKAKPDARPKGESPASRSWVVGMRDLGMSDEENQAGGNAPLEIPWENREVMRPRSQNQQNGGLPRRKLGVQVIDLFCGCGGMSYGFASAKTRNVRYAVTGALDLDKHAVATYHRMLGVEPLCADIRSLVERSEFAKATRHWNHAAGTPTILIGCAPCQGFSSHRKKDDRQDDRNSLLEVFAHIILKY